MKSAWSSSLRAGSEVTVRSPGPRELSEIHDCRTRWNALAWAPRPASRSLPSACHDTAFVSPTALARSAADTGSVPM